MKTFRFFATLLVIALCAGFTSCSDDDDENPLVGTWVSIENRNSVEYKDVMTINSDGTGSSAIYENGQIDKDGVDNFRYTYDENSKVFTWIWEEGKVFVIRPEEQMIRHFENNNEKLLQCYQYGYDTMRKQFRTFEKFMEDKSSPR